MLTENKWTQHERCPSTFRIPVNAEERERNGQQRSRTQEDCSTNHHSSLLAAHSFQYL